MLIKKLFIVLFMLSQLTLSLNAQDRQSITIHSHAHMSIQGSSHVHEHVHVEAGQYLYCHQLQSSVPTPSIKLTPLQDVNRPLTFIAHRIFRPPIV